MYTVLHKINITCRIILLVLLRHTISTMYYEIIFKSCKKNTIYYNEVCHRRTNKENVLSADIDPPETNIINNLYITIYIIIGDYIIKIEILFT